MRMPEGPHAAEKARQRLVDGGVLAVHRRHALARLVGVSGLQVAEDQHRLCRHLQHRVPNLVEIGEQQHRLLRAGIAHHFGAGRIVLRGEGVQRRMHPGGFRFDVARIEHVVSGRIDGARELGENRVLFLPHRPLLAGGDRIDMDRYHGLDQHHARQHRDDIERRQPVVEQVPLRAPPGLSRLAAGAKGGFHGREVSVLPET